eukprot:CAMPEP_0174846816 /NCGR_PEP_ID=MMETSP1114-20130205/12534_1 /TAXON_ID=312471 /ORGANISM="Neobodo designis, Strain CCAP 1951/1" /LENGTH=68 /DNA_ID=CAMNT_0016081085 /DNA_START=74 /DNA_END=276 /DNA_ORIENTATION=+
MAKNTSAVVTSNACTRMAWRNECASCADSGADAEPEAPADEHFKFAAIVTVCLLAYVAAMLVAYMGRR